MQFSALTAIFKADFGRYQPVPAVFRPISAVSAVSAAGRYHPIWPIRPDFGRISPIRRESKPIRHESSRIGANRAKSVRIEPSRRESKKKKKTQTRSDARATASDAGAAPLVPRPCFLDIKLPKSSFKSNQVTKLPNISKGKKFSKFHVPTP